MQTYKSNQLFKIIILVLLVVSLSMNGFLMYQYFQPKTTSTTTNGSVVQTVVTDVKSDLTEVVKDAKA